MTLQGFPRGVLWKAASLNRTLQKELRLEYRGIAKRIFGRILESIQWTVSTISVNFVEVYFQKN